MELDEDLGGTNTITFLEEDAVMMVYGGCPHQGGTVCLA
jgi:hypothetical protein